MPIHVNGAKLDALLDSGASHNFIAFPQAQALGAQWHWAKPMLIRLANKDTVVSSKIAHLDVAMGAETMQLSCRIVPKLHHSLILGMQWFQTYNPAIDWRKKQVTLAISNQPIVVNCKTKSNKSIATLLTATQFQQALKNSKNSQKFAVRINSTPCHQVYHRMHCRPDHPAFASVSTWLTKHAPHLDINQCIYACKQSLAQERPVVALKCIHCGQQHLDIDIFATKLHQWHTCSNPNCAKKFSVPGQLVQGNPLAMLHPVLDQGALWIDYPTEACLDSISASSDTSNRWTKLCATYQDIFEAPQQPTDRAVKHKIELLDPAQPVPHHRQYRMSQRELDEVRRQLDDLLSKGWIRPSTSQYNHPILFVKKKDGSLRMCIDYRCLNANTIINRYPLPRIDDILDRLGGSTIYSKLDLQSGYHQVAIHPGHEHRTAFQSRFGLYEYTVLPFGLSNAPSTFQRLMNDIFREQLDTFVTIYLDDILVFSRSEDDHEQHLRWVFDRLRSAGLKAKRSKCEFGTTRLEYLGHIVTPDGIRVDPAKTTAINDCAPPTCVRELQMFLGMCNHYAKFISNYAQTAAPLYDLLRKNVEFAWTSTTQLAFDTLKYALTHAPVLAMPDFSLPFTIETDASDRAVGGVLTQFDRPIQYFSKALTTCQQNYPTHDREFYAIVEACRRWRPYIDGQRTVVLTDHQPLIHVHSQPCLNKRQVWWLQQLAETPIEIKYRPGEQAVVPDALSRLPCVVHRQPCLTPSGAGSEQGDTDHKPCLGDPGADVQLSDNGTIDHASQHRLSLFVDPMPPVLNSVLVEPSFLERLSVSQFDPADLEMARFQRLASSGDPDFRITYRYEVPLLVRCSTGEQLILPRGNGFRHLLMNEMHSSALAGHIGVHKMLGLLFPRVWWPRMREDISKFVRHCDTCARIKDSTQQPPGALQPLPIPFRRFHSWSLDFLTDLPTASGCNTVLTVVDRLTKAVRLIPCTMGEDQLSAASVAKLFIFHIVRQYGVPSELVHDRDPRFVAHFWKEFWQLLGTRTNASTAYHPQSDGQTERMHRIIAQVLRFHCLNADATKWYDSLPLVEFAINSTVNASTGFAPFELLYGENVPLPIDHALGNQSLESTADELTAQIRDIVNSARASIEKAQAYQKHYYDAHHRAITFQVGDKVMLSTKHLPLEGSRKLAPRFVGPMQVLARVGDQSYKLALPPGLAALHPVFHVSLLRAAADVRQSDGISLGSGPPPLAEDLDDPTSHSDRYIVEGIIKELKHHYIVRWLGYDQSHDSKIPKQELRETAPLVVQTWTNTKRNEQSRRRSSRLR